MLGENSPALVLQTLVRSDRDDFAGLLPHHNSTIDVRLGGVVAPCHEPADDLTDLVEPRRGVAVEIELLEDERIGEGRVPNDHSWRAGISRVRPFGDHFVPPADGGRFAEVAVDATIAWPLLLAGVLERLGAGT